MQGIKRANLADPAVRKRFVTYKEAAELYSMGLTRVQEHAKSAGATYKMGNKGGRPRSENPKQSSMSVRMSSADYEKVKQCAADHHQTISQVVLEALKLLYDKRNN